MPVDLLTLRDYAAVPEPIETGDTFEANARLKAEYDDRTVGAAARGNGRWQGPLLTVAEDSGLGD